MSLSLFLKFVSLHWKTKMQYRGDFLLQIIGQTVGYGAQYVVIWQLLQHFETINGWTWPEMAFVYSLNLFTYAIGASFTLHQEEGMERFVITGEFDKYLIKPLHPLLYFTASHFNVGYITHFLLAGSVMVWSAASLTIDWSPLLIALLCLFVAAASLIQAALFILLGSSVFLFVRNRFLFSLYHRLRDFVSYPVSLFGTIMQAVLTFVIPLAFINYYPATLLLSKKDGLLPAWSGWFALFVGPFVLWIATRVWMLGVKKYQSAGG